MTIATQNWDGVVAPAQPTGWNYSTANLATTTTLPAGQSPISALNVLRLSQVSNADAFATYATQDGNSGNVIVSAYFMGGSALNNCCVGLTGRASDSAVIKASSTFYYLTASFTTNDFQLLSYVSGTSTSLGSIGFPATTTQWYVMYLSLNGTSISCSFQNVPTGDWLNSSGSFQGGQTAGISVTDSSISGQGYSGIGMISHTDIAYTDNWSLAAFVAPLVTPLPRITVVAIPYQFYPPYAE